MNIIVIANIISLAGCIVMVLTGLIQTKRNILTAQVFTFALLGLANLLLGGISAVVSNSIAIIRNVYCIKFKLTWPVKLVFMGLQLVLTLIFNDDGLIGYLPLLANIIYISLLDTENEVVLKLGIMTSTACWIVFDFVMLNFSGTVFDVITVISNLVGIIILIKNRKKLHPEQ